MTQGSTNKLVEFLQKQAGVYLRGAIHYSEDKQVTPHMGKDDDTVDWLL